MRLKEGSEMIAKTIAAMAGLTLMLACSAPASADSKADACRAAGIPMGGQAWTQCMMPSTADCPACGYNCSPRQC